MSTITLKRITKGGCVQVHAKINDQSILTLGSQELLSHIFPSVNVVNGGIFLEALNLELQGHHRCFGFEGVLNPETGVWEEVKRSLKVRLVQIRDWVRTIPVTEEFTIEI